MRGGRRRVGPFGGDTLLPYNLLAVCHSAEACIHGLAQLVGGQGSPRKRVGSGGWGAHVISPRPMGAVGQSLAAPAPIHHPPIISMTKTLQSPTAHPSESDVEASKTSFFKDFWKEGTRGRGGKVRGIFKTFLISQPPWPSIGSWVIRFGQIQPSCPSLFAQRSLPPKAGDGRWELQSPYSAQDSHSKFLSPNSSWGDGLGQLGEVCYPGPNG